MAELPVKILIVEDDPGDRKQLRRTIEKTELDCRIIEAATATDGMRQGGEPEPDLVLLDFSLPDLDGLKAIPNFQARFPHAAIAMITGRGDERTASEAIKAGAVDYIPKRFISESSIRRLIENSIQVARLRTRAEEHRKEMQIFGHILAHDLKAPLRAMTVIVEAMQDEIDPSNLEGVRKDVFEIGRYARRMTGLIDSLTRHILAGEEIEETDVDMGDVARDAISNLSVEIGNSRANFVIGDLPVVRGDRAQLCQLLQNLIGNAIKYRSQRNPQIRIAAAGNADEGWQLSVRDNGCGIPKNKLETVFEPFQRLHSADKIPGTGLGLATCAKIVRRHKGRIWCESTVGEGTTVHFTFGPHESESIAA